jgi:hypothetical protein
MATKLWDGTRIRGTYNGRSSTMVEHHCGSCGSIWAIADEHDEALRESHKSFWCPICGTSFSYRGESEKERLKRELATANAARGRLASSLEQTRASLTATKGAATRARNQRDTAMRKAHAGICPVIGCGRHLKDLGRHMKSKHPDYEAPE